MIEWHRTMRPTTWLFFFLIIFYHRALGKVIKISVFTFQLRKLNRFTQGKNGDDKKIGGGVGTTLKRQGGCYSATDR